MWLNLLFNIILPLLFLVILNRRIYNKLNQVRFISKEKEKKILSQISFSSRHSVRRSTEPRLRKREQRLARISLLIVMIFITCHSVKNIPTIFEIFGKDPRVSESPDFLKMPEFYHVFFFIIFIQLKIYQRIRNSPDFRRFPFAKRCSYLVISWPSSTAVSISWSTPSVTVRPS